MPKQSIWVLQEVEECDHPEQPIGQLVFIPVHRFRLCLCHCLPLFVGQVISPHHSNQKSQGSQRLRVAIWVCFVIGLVYVFVFFYWSMFMPCLPITLTKRLKVHKGCFAEVFFNSELWAVREAILCQIGWIFTHCVKGGGIEPMCKNLCCVFL